MGLSFTQLIASPKPLKIGDREYRFTPFRTAEWVAFESWIHERYTAATKRAFEGQPPDSIERALQRLAERLPDITPMSPEGMKMIRSPEGAIHMAWLSLRPEHPEITLEDVEKLLYEPAAMQGVADFIADLNEQHLPKSQPTKPKPRGKRRRR